jgi:hypothetical protein
VPNRLVRESSPYLQQHAENPVDWYPWSDEALLKARREDKPIFLSIGYSACHWCHVMARESFEDRATAEILNEHFVSVKVDREERPDLDRVYMSAVQAMTGSGGWPMSAFLTPDGKPFYAGTYFPPQPRHGLPSFRQVLRTIAEAWQNRRDDLLEGSDRVVASVERQMTLTAPEEDLDPRTLTRAFRSLHRDFDDAHGGWDGAPKFPQPMVIEFLLRFHHAVGEPDALGMAVGALDAMARGGIYDQLGGGFHRYSVDERWLVPHFEKMLYDNAQLARAYLHAWQVTGTPLFRAVAEETLDYVVREMLAPEGGFYATQSAESEGEEGRFFVWTAEQIREVLGDEAPAFLEAYGVRPGGNWEGKTILTFRSTWDERRRLADARRRLWEAREGRIRPERDDKVLTSWNGLMLAAFAEAGQALGRDDYVQVARRNAAFVLDELRAEDGHLLHAWRDGEAKIRGFLDDHANLIEGLLALYQTTFEPRWFIAAQELAERVLTHFSASEGGQFGPQPRGPFFDTSDAHETLITRPRSLQDNAVPSGNATAALVLLRLSKLAVEPRYADAARSNLRQVQRMLGRYPLGFGQWLNALEFALAETREIAIIGGPDSAEVQALLDVCVDGFRPHQVLAVGDPKEEKPLVPLLEGRSKIDGRATAYVCVDFTCRQPVTDPEALAEQIES